MQGYIIMKKTLAILLSAILLAAAAGCGSEGDAVTGSEAPSGGDVTTEEAPAQTTEYAPSFPDNADFGGAEFKFLITGNTENNWKKDDFSADEMTGEVLNDSRFERNSRVEERFNIDITVDEQYGSAKGSGSGFTLLSKSVMAGDDAYAAAMINGYDICNLACSGYLYDLAALPYVDLSQRYWDQKANEDLMILGHMYYTTGDISTSDNDATCCYFFNKKLVADYSLDDPYALVNDGKWVYDKMASMAGTVTGDLNGDGKMTSDDSFGAIVWDDSIMAAVNGTLGKCGTVGADGTISLTINTDRIVSMIDKYCAFVFSDDCYRYQRVSYDITTPVNMFSGDQALFFIQMLDLASYLRDMQTDFGILPVPKYDEAQSSYGHTIGSWHSQFLCVPATLTDPDRTGMVLEALAYESLNIVTPGYYEKTLVGKYMRDEESRDMLDIILSTRVFDLGWYYQLGLYNDEILYMVYAEKNDWASRYAKYESKALEDAARINALFAETIG